MQNVGGFILKEAVRATDELDLCFDLQRQNQQSVTELSPAQLSTWIKSSESSRLLQSHKGRPVHGPFFNIITQRGLSEKLTFAILRSSGLRSETGGFILACQYGVFNSLVYRSRVMGQDFEDVNCKACHQAPETLWHLLSAIPRPYDLYTTIFDTCMVSTRLQRCLKHLGMLKPS